MKVALRWTAGILMAATGPYFTYTLAKDPGISPALGTWSIFAVACVLCYLSYLATDGNKNWQKNMLNLADAIATIWISVAIAVFRPASLQFRWSDLFFASSAAAIYCYWKFSRHSFDANIMFNVLIALGYGPTVWKIISEKRNGESFAWWIACLIPGILSLYPAAVREKTEETRDDYRQRVLATLYPVRSVTCIVALMYLMVWYS